jgi:5-methylcytosine-specific restriction endonuclease McrA
VGYRAFYEHEEEEFEEWTNSHPSGVVINSSPKNLSGRYIVAHRPKCKTFWRHVGARTKYSKHCFDSLSEALGYLGSKGFGLPKFGCAICKVAALQPTADIAVLAERVATLLSEPEHVAEEPLGNFNPRRIDRSNYVGYERDTQVVARTLQIAAGKCELCETDAPFRTAKEVPYLEVHHVRRLADKGSDTLDNAVALCPNCHRAAHYSADAKKITDRLYRTIPRLRQR